MTLINGNNTSSATALTFGANTDSWLATPGERDLYSVSLRAGVTYNFHMLGNNTVGNDGWTRWAFSDTYLRLYDAAGNMLTADDDHGSQTTGWLSSWIENFTPSTTGTYYLESASFAGSSMGGYRVYVDRPANSAPVLSGNPSALGFATANSTFHISASSLLQGFSDPDNDTLSVADTPTVSSGTIVASGDGWNVSGLSSTGYVSVNYSVTDGNDNSVDAGNGFTVTQAANSISMSLIGDSAQTGEDGSTVRYSVGLNNALTAGSLTITLTSLDDTEGQFQVGSATATTQTLTFDSSHQSYVVTVVGQQDYANDGTVPYRITARAVDGRTPSASGRNSWTSAIRTFNGGTTTSSVHSENLYNSPDMTSDGVDRDVPMYLVGDETRPTEDSLVGNDGADRLYGGYMIDRLDAGIGDDRLYGGYEDDQLYGGAGNDQLYGEQDDDYLNGGAGNDRMDGGIGADTMDGGAGSDTYYVTLADDGTVEDTIYEDAGDAGTDTIYIPFSVDDYVAPDGVEVVRMNAGFGNSALDGNSGANGLYGNSGDNALDGGAGNDTLVGGNGNDTMTGGAGNDTYVLNAAGDDNADIISAYLTGDTIQLSRGVFTALTIPRLNDNQFVTTTGTSNRATASTNRIVYNSTTGNLFYDADGSATAYSSVLIATIQNKPALTAANFAVA